MNYSPIERRCPVLIFYTQKLRHKLVAHCPNPLKYLLSQPAISGGIARWLLSLSKFDIAVVSLGASMSSFSDLLAQLPSGVCEPFYETFYTRRFVMLTWQTASPSMVLPSSRRRGRSTVICS